MRVLHVITGLAAGGAEQQLRLLLRHHRADAEVAALTNLGSVARGIRADGTVVHDVGMHSLGDQHIEGRRISPGIRRLYLAAERLGRTTIAVSAPVARRLVIWGVPASRIDLIPNGIDLGAYRIEPARRERLRAELGIAPDRFVVGSVGRLVPGKRMELMLRAVAGPPDVTTLVVGEGPQRPALATLAHELGVDAVFTGESVDVPALLSLMDTFVSLSTEETFGLAIIEALAAGVPVFYTECSALDDLSGGPVPGAVQVPPEPDAIRRALRSSPARRPAAAALEHFDIARIAGRIDDVYRRESAADTPGRPVPANEEY